MSYLGNPQTREESRALVLLCLLTELYACAILKAPQAEHSAFQTVSAEANPFSDITSAPSIITSFLSWVPFHFTEDRPNSTKLPFSPTAGCHFLTMAITAMSRLLQLTLLTTLFAWVHTATVTNDFEIGWVTANPDGAFDRPVIGINGQWPIPPIVANVGDQVIVNVLNSLGNESTSLHFHGLYM